MLTKYQVFKTLKTLCLNLQITDFLSRGRLRCFLPGLYVHLSRFWNGHVGSGVDWRPQKCWRSLREKRSKWLKPKKTRIKRNNLPALSRKYEVPKHRNRHIVKLWQARASCGQSCDFSSWDWPQFRITRKCEKNVYLLTSWEENQFIWKSVRYLQHDPEQCTPGGEDGNFIMFARATSGDKKNNNKFSPCSLKSINPVLNYKARSSKGCFTGKLP